MTLYAGIDPGLDGAIVLLDAAGMTMRQEPLPVLPAGRGRRVYDVPGMVALLGSIGDAGETFATLEQALIFPGQGICSTANGIGGQRLIEGILAALRIRFQIVHPKAWQKVMLPGCRFGDPKTAARIVAGRLWPMHTWLRTPMCSKPNQGLIDAALLAEFGRRTFGATYFGAKVRADTASLILQGAAA